jgi:hypothetical protein
MKEQQNADLLDIMSTSFVGEGVAPLMGSEDAGLQALDLSQFDEIDLSLDANFMDATFSNVGLVSWDSLGIYTSPR